MTLHDPIVALLRLWPVLPSLLGERWPSAYWRLIDWLAQFQSGDPELKKHASLQIAQFLNSFAAGRETLSKLSKAPYLFGGFGREEPPSGHIPFEFGVKGFDPRESYVAAPEASPKGLDLERVALSADVSARMNELLYPPQVTRYTDIFAPSTVQAGQRFPLVVGLLEALEEGQASGPALQVLLEETLRVVLHVDGLEVLGENTREMRVTAQDSPPVVFYLRAGQAPIQSFTLDFCSNCAVLASVKHTLRLSDQPDSGALVHLSDQLLRVGPGAAEFAPDLIWRIYLDESGRRLKYMLSYREGPFYKEMAPVPVQADPETYRYQLIAEIENLSQGLDVDGQPHPAGDSPDPQRLRSELEKIGNRLYTELFANEDMRREYATWKQRKVNTILIVSDEPWIPWELIKPCDENLDDDFLCLEYRLSRWLNSAGPVAREIEVDSLAVIAPDDSGLPSAQAERAVIDALASQYHLANLSPSVADYNHVTRLLEGAQSVRLWHFACHGDYDKAKPGSSPLLLQGKAKLRPTDFVGKTQNHLRRDRPFVFLNACRVGQAGHSLTGLGGWGKALVQDAHAGGLIAPLWSVSDQAAQLFAETFYQHCTQPGMTLGEAMRQARLAVRQSAPDDPTWLAYSLYAHPNARLTFKAGQQP